MDNVPTQPNPVDRAEQALRHFGAVDRATAETLLSMWAHVKDLTDAERAEVLDRFGDTEDVTQPSEAEAQAFWRGYAAGFKDACEPDPDRKVAHAAGYLSGVQVRLDSARGVPIDEKFQAYLSGLYEAERREGDADY